MPATTSRIAQPAVVHRSVREDGTVLYQDNEHMLHNPDGPTITCLTKALYRILTGQDPATQPHTRFGYTAWFRHGQRHRTDGPAVVNGNGTVEYWVNGVHLHPDDYHQQYLRSCPPQGETAA